MQFNGLCYCSAKAKYKKLCVSEQLEMNCCQDESVLLQFGMDTFGRTIYRLFVTVNTKQLEADC